MLRKSALVSVAKATVTSEGSQAGPRFEEINSLDGSLEGLPDLRDLRVALQAHFSKQLMEAFVC